MTTRFKKGGTPSIEPMVLNKKPMGSWITGVIEARFNQFCQGGNILIVWENVDPFFSFVGFDTLQTL